MKVLVSLGCAADNLVRGPESQRGPTLPGIAAASAAVSMSKGKPEAQLGLLALQTSPPRSLLLEGQGSFCHGGMSFTQGFESGKPLEAGSAGTAIRKAGKRWGRSRVGRDGEGRGGEGGDLESSPCKFWAHHFPREGF